MQQTNRQRFWLTDILLLTLSLIVLFGAFLGSRPLSVPDEARYSEIPREMLELSNYLTPHLNYIKYFEKPPLLYWLQAGTIKMLGESEWALRLPTALLALLGCIMVYIAGRMLYERRTGILASFILATSLLYFAMAHLITLDMTVTVFLTGCLLSFIVAMQADAAAYRRRLLWGCYLCAALAALTKGLIGFVLPGLVIVAWLTLYHEWRQLKHCYLVSGTLIFLAIAAPWYLWVQQVNPEFFQFFFVEQHFSRYLTLSAGRYKPYWFFMGILLAGFFPWTVFLFQAIRDQLSLSWKNRHAAKTEGFLLLWAALIFIFFSLSKSKLIPYILPVFPPLALLTARYLARHWDTSGTKGIKIGFGLLPVCAVPIAIALIALPYYQTVPDVETANIYLRAMAVVLIVNAVISTVVYWRSSFKKALIALVIGTMLELILFIVAVPYVETRSIKPLAMKLQPLLTAQDEVVSYGIYFQDLPFYLRRKVTIVDWTNELTFGMAHQDARQWMINTAEFIKRWRSQQRLFAVMSKNSYDIFQKEKQLKLYLVAETTDNVLVSNQPGSY